MLAAKSAIVLKRKSHYQFFMIFQVSKLPGTSSITLKVELATTKLKWIPNAFSIPGEEEQFALAVSCNLSNISVLLTFINPLSAGIFTVFGLIVFRE